MPITERQIQLATDAQHEVAHLDNLYIRLIAGPGTGKSTTVEERIRWLLARPVPSDQIFVVSFTRASSVDLAERVQAYCSEHGQPDGRDVWVGTLHALALRVLRRAGLLTAYPAEPRVLDGWEIQHLIEAEFGADSSIRSKSRLEDIRRHHEAFWNTGEWNPPNYIPPDPPISNREREAFVRFHYSRTQVYSCVLPGEIVRQCVDAVESETIDLSLALPASHLIVDEYQDLNPYDIRFIEQISSSGAAVLVAGDDDQSIYSFRHAAPSGIQSFVDDHPGCANRELTSCFRCAPNILYVAEELMRQYPLSNRVPKHLRSLYEDSEPPVPGFVARWRFPSGIAEARAIADSCSALIARGIPPEEIMVLVSEKGLFIPLLDELRVAEVPVDTPEELEIKDTQVGRAVYSLLRVVCDQEDYVAHRNLLGLKRGIGPGTCNGLAVNVVSNNLNYLDLFYRDLPEAEIAGRALAGIRSVRSAIGRVNDWATEDTLDDRGGELLEIAADLLEAEPEDEVAEFLGDLPQGMMLTELSAYLTSPSKRQRWLLLRSVHERLGLPLDEELVEVEGVRVMTMHGSKGLSASVVFVPGLEEDSLPGPKRRPYPGLVLESARMLYVSITRARAACILSRARTRIVNGAFENRTAARFCSHLSGAFPERTSGLTNAEVDQVMMAVQSLESG